MLKKKTLKILKKADVRVDLLDESQIKYIEEIQDVVETMIFRKEQLEKELQCYKINKKNICAQLGKRRSKIYEDKYISANKYVEELIKDNNPYEEKYTVKEHKKKETTELNALYTVKDILIDQYEKENEQLKKEIESLRRRISSYTN